LSLKLDVGIKGGSPPPFVRHLLQALEAAPVSIQLKLHRMRHAGQRPSILPDCWLMGHKIQYREPAHLCALVQNVVAHFARLCGIRLPRGSMLTRDNSLTCARPKVDVG
jgi:hypothetical protein